MLTRLCLCPPKNLLSELSYIRESQTLGNLVPTPRVPRHLGILHGAVIRPPYLIVTIGRSSRRSPCRATHTVQNVPFFCSSRSRKLNTLGKGPIVGMSFVPLVSSEYIWDCFLFFFYSIHFVRLKIFVNYCNKTGNLSPKFALQNKSEHSKGRLLA